MGKPVEPTVFLVGETKIVPEGLQEFLDYMELPDWDSDASTDVEKLCEVAGRLCYLSLAPGKHNPNVTRIRKTNKEYLDNILNHKEGSVLEQATLNFVFTNISRITAAELARHRAGTSISETSYRYVRITDIDWYVPKAVQADAELFQIYSDTLSQLEVLQRELAERFQLDSMKNFNKKKELTSTMRRLAPLGLTTNMFWGANLRALRWIIEMRTSPYAEEEIRLLFDKVAQTVVPKYPNVFGDFSRQDDGTWIPENSKV